MMKTAAISLVLLGCDCDAKVCEYIRTVPTQWSSIESCRAALPAQETSRDAESFPLIVADCRAEPQVSAVSSASRPSQPESNLGNNAGSLPERFVIMRGIHLGRDHAEAVAASLKTQTISAIAWAGDHLSALRPGRE